MYTRIYSAIVWMSVTTISASTRNPPSLPLPPSHQWMQLKQRKAQMVRLFKRLQDYQFEKVREQPDKALTEDTRPVSEEDIAR